MMYPIRGMDGGRGGSVVKLPLYARAGVPEVWVVDLVHAVVEVFREPARCRLRRSTARGTRRHDRSGGVAERRHRGHGDPTAGVKGRACAPSRVSNPAEITTTAAARHHRDEPEREVAAVVRNVKCREFRNGRGGNAGSGHARIVL
jgi:hypothetical protein